MGKKYLIDSNILIEFTAKLLPDDIYYTLRDIIDTDFNISVINKIEVLGHYTANEGWRKFIDQAVMLVIDDDIVTQTIRIRKNHKIKLPDAIVAATAIANNLILLTRNIEDFRNIKGLKAENPWLWKTIKT